MNTITRHFSGSGKTFSIFLFVLVIIATLSSCGAEKGKFKMSGRFLNLDQGEFYVYSPDGVIDGIDTIHVKGGRFTYERPLDREATLMLVFPNFSEQPIFANSGKSVEIKGDASHIKEIEVTGTKDNELMTKFRKETASSSPPDIAKTAEKYINDKPESLVGVYLVRKYFIQTMTPDYTKAEQLVAKMLESQPKNGALVLLRKQLSQLKNGKVGNSVTTFTATDINGHAISDQDLGDGVAVIYVWSTWNYESQEMQRQLKKRARESGGRLKLISISMDADHKACKNMIERDSITCPTVLEPQLFEGQLPKGPERIDNPDVLVKYLSWFHCCKNTKKSEVYLMFSTTSNISHQPSDLSHRHMETALFDFVLNKGTILLANVAEHLREYPLQRVVAHLTANSMIAVIADIEGGAVKVARVVGGIAVVALQTGHIVLGAQDAGNDELVQGHPLHIEAVVECLTDILEQHGSAWHQIGNGAVEFVDMIVGTLADIHQFFLACLGILAVLDGLDAPLVGSHNLRLLQVGEGVFITGHAIDAMLLLDVER